MADVELKKVRKAFGPLEVVHDVDLKVADGEFVVFVGPSGCGKSTLLRLICGLEPASGGDVLIGGKSMRGVNPAKRGVVWQSLPGHGATIDSTGRAFIAGRAQRKAAGGTGGFRIRR